MKNIYLFLFLYFSIGTLTMYSQEINGLYTTSFTSFNNPNDTSKNFFKPSTEKILIDIYDYPKPNGSASIIDNSEEVTVNIKFVLTGKKEVGFIDGITFITYEAFIYLLNRKTPSKCTIAVDSDLKTFFVLFENNSIQSWELKSKL